MNQTTVTRRPEAAVRYRVERGRPHPLGATPDADGVNFSVYSEHATSVTLLIFDPADPAAVVQTVELDPDNNRTFHFWHAYLRGLAPGAEYAYRVDGPGNASETGQRFDKDKILVDPYAKGIDRRLWNRVDACRPGDNLATSMRGLVVDSAAYDWEGDTPLRRPMHQTVIYEMHVRGFTASPSSGVAHPGTYDAVVEKIPYLTSLGVTAVELLPVFAFDEKEIDKELGDGERLTNYWGYSPIAFFAPHDGYCTGIGGRTAADEFRDMVKALHRSGIEVILDVVFNHTGEGNHLGPMITHRGFANGAYYHLFAPDRQYYVDYSGCGNTLNCNHPVTEKMIVECLEYWVGEMHVDGFRFDEGSILSRGLDGAPSMYAPVPWHIELSESLADTKIIAEAWDAAGLYQVGYFPGYRWAQWNDRFRDDMRRFVRGDRGMVGAVATRISGSADLYQAQGRLPVNGINFIDAHDGFTLNDLVSYNGKHNEANGEDNRDGVNDNLSWNCGVEGPTLDPVVERLRERQIRNFITLLMVSQGVPMFVAGDEVRRTQLGNNNAYCHDGPLAWFDWGHLARHPELMRFVSMVIRKRRLHSSLHRGLFFGGQRNSRGLADISWHGCELDAPGFGDPASGVLAFTLGGGEADVDIHVMCNMEDRSLRFALPPLLSRSWFRSVDTGLDSPDDVTEPGEEVRLAEDAYLLGPHSVGVLISAS